jgi:hypothetical protein
MPAAATICRDSYSKKRTGQTPAVVVSNP